MRWIGPIAGGGVEEVYESLQATAAVQSGDGAGKSGEDLILVACPAPAPDPAAIERLADGAAYPVVQLLGAWCEGEGRTGRPPEGVERVFWHAWPEWWNEWRRPARSQATPGGAALVQIVTPRRDDAEAIGGVLRAGGFATAWSLGEPHAARVRGAEAAIWCGTQLDGLEAERLATLCAAVRPAPLVAMLDFPRPETVAAARAIGAARVLGRPCDADALLACLWTLVAAQRRRALAVRIANEFGVDASVASSDGPLPVAA